MTRHKRLQGRRAVERRRRFLRRHPFCVQCLASGVVSAGEEVDHVVPILKGGADTEENMQTLCRECHEKKTRDDLGWRLGVGSDLNGMPIDPAHPWAQEG